MKRLIAHRFVSLVILSLLLAGCSTQSGETESEYLSRVRRESLARMQEDADAAELAKQAWEKRRADYLSLHTDLKREIREAIIHKNVIIGMTSEEVQLSWNRLPETKNVTVGRFGRHEQWVYDTTYLYFEDGILASFQQSLDK